jgi:hypothetical protein
MGTNEAHPVSVSYGHNVWGEIRNTLTRIAFTCDRKIVLELSNAKKV